MTLMTDRIPFECSFGVGAAASEPSPRKSVCSSLLASCAASLMVNGRTRTVTEMDDAPSAAMVVVRCAGLSCCSVSNLTGSGKGRSWSVCRSASGGSVVRIARGVAERAVRGSESSNVYAAHGPHKHGDLKLATTPNLGRRQRMRPTHRAATLSNPTRGASMLFCRCGLETCVICYARFTISVVFPCLTATTDYFTAMLGHPQRRR